MNFDRIAPFYEAMETWLAGKCLHRARIAFLDEIEVPANALLVGEGHGRFLLPFREKFPEANITVIDGSRKMVEISKRRLTDHTGVTFVHSMIGDWDTEEIFDLVVTNFMLDCLTATQIETIVPKLGSLISERGNWLIADFQICGRGAAKWRSRFIIGLLYFFFRAITNIPAGKLSSPDAALRASGFHRISGRSFEWGLLKSEWWRKKPDDSIPNEATIPTKASP